MTNNLVITGLGPVIQPVPMIPTTVLDYPVKPGNDDIAVIARSVSDAAISTVEIASPAFAMTKAIVIPAQAGIHC